MSGIDQWWSDGERVQLAAGGQTHAIFVRRLGSGSPMTLLHGFPSSSHDWAKVAPALAERHALLMPDFLGFGASDKPREHVYSLHEQADLVEALWAREGVAETALVAHDYAVSVAQELLARRAEGQARGRLQSVHLLNGGLYPDLHRPQPTQTALLDPEQGPKIGELMTEQLFVAGTAPDVRRRLRRGADSAEIWRAMSRDDGQRIAHLLIRYMTDREAHAQRWVAALERTDVPLAFVWGMLDPVSGAHMAERIAERLPDAPMLALDDVAHWPQLEAPARARGAADADSAGASSAPPRGGIDERGQARGRPLRRSLRSARRYSAYTPRIARPAQRLGLPARRWRWSTQGSSRQRRAPVEHGDGQQVAERARGEVGGGHALPDVAARPGAAGSARRRRPIRTSRARRRARPTRRDRSARLQAPGTCSASLPRRLATVAAAVLPSPSVREP